MTKYLRVVFQALLRLTQVIDLGIENGDSFPYDDNETNGKMLQFLLAEDAIDQAKPNNKITND